jgi:hypothetical protein
MSKTDIFLEALSENEDKIGATVGSLILSAVAVRRVQRFAQTIGYDLSYREAWCIYMGVSWLGYGFGGGWHSAKNITDKFKELYDHKAPDSATDDAIASGYRRFFEYN